MYPLLLPQNQAQCCAARCMPLFRTVASPAELRTAQAIDALQALGGSSLGMCDRRRVDGLDAQLGQSMATRVHKLLVWVAP